MYLLELPALPLNLNSAGLATLLNAVNRVLQEQELVTARSLRIELSERATIECIKEVRLS